MTDQKKNTQGLAREWARAREAVRLAERSLTSARNDLTAAERALALSIAPKDMQADETIGVWVRFGDHEEALVSVVKRHGDLVLTLRGKRDTEKGGA